VNLDYRRLTRDCIPDALAMMSRFYTEERLQFHEERTRRALEEVLGAGDRGGWWFIVADGQVAGYFALTACFSLEFGGRFALLDEFFMLAEFRGGGIGALALDRVQEEAARMGVAAIRLEVDRSNTRLQAFYRRSGFAAHDRDLMTKWLSADVPGR
jgi:GNAT superfamily N-acetyltransferase